MKRYYFTTESECDGECSIPDYQGNIRGARNYAQKYADERNEAVFINDCETSDIVDCIYPSNER